MKGKKTYNNLRRFRRARGYTQKEVAAMLGLKTSSIISRWEKGTRLPDTVNALKLAALYRSAVDVIYQDLRLKLADEIVGRERAVIKDRSDHG